MDLPTAGARPRPARRRHRSQQADSAWAQEGLERPSGLQTKGGALGHAPYSQAHKAPRSDYFYRLNPTELPARSPQCSQVHSTGTPRFAPTNGTLPRAEKGSAGQRDRPEENRGE